MGCFEYGQLLQIATNALILPSAGAVLLAPSRTDIVWDVEKNTDNSDSKNLTVSGMTLHYADTANYITEVTNNIANTLGKIEWDMPSGRWDRKTNHVLRFEVFAVLRWRKFILHD